MEGNEVIVTIEMRLPDDLQDPAFRQAGRPPARRGTAPGGKDPGHIEGKDEKDGASDIDPGVQGNAADLDVPGDLEDHQAEREAKDDPDDDCGGMGKL